MKKVYNLFAAATLLVAGSVNASAERFWSYDGSKQATAESIEVGKDYALQAGHSLAAGSTIFLAGQKFTQTSYLSLENIYTFELVNGILGANGEKVYNLKRKDGQYLAEVTNGAFYTMQQDRAWKIVVKDVQGIDGTKTYTRPVEPTEDNPNPTPENFTGIAAYIEEAKDLKKTGDGDGTLPWKLNEIAFVPQNGSLGSGVVTISDYKSKDEKDPYAEYNFLLHYPTDNTLAGQAGKGTNYNRNTWGIFEATKNSAQVSLENLVQTMTQGRDLMEEVLRDFSVGTESGQYSVEKHTALKALWEKWKAHQEGTTVLNDDQMDELAGALPKAYEDFVTSGIPLKAGYYIFTSFRTNTASWPSSTPAQYPYGGQDDGYDDGALYDGNATNEKDQMLRWSFKPKQGADFSIADLDSVGYTYEYAKFVWEVIAANKKDEDGNDLFYFKNAETGNYIGKVPQGKQRIYMTKEPEVAYTIVASKEFPGNYNFYSPELPVRTEANAPSPAKFSGIHTQLDNTEVTAWDYRVAGSCWKVRPLTKADVDKMVAAVAQPKRDKKLAALILDAQTALDRGYSYMGVTQAGGTEKIASSTNGEYSEVDGLVTSADQLKCPMADSQEGQNIGDLVDGNLGTFFHSTWHGDGEAWPGRGIHYLQVTPSEEMDALLIKWIKRQTDAGNSVRGALHKVAIYGTNSDDALNVDKETTDNEDGSSVTVYDHWKKEGQGWDSLGVTTFTYPYEIVKADETKVANQAGTAYFKANKKYKHFRIVVLSRVNDGGKPNGNYFFHGSEFRLYHGAYDPQASLIGSVPTELVDKLKAEIKKSQEMVDAKTSTDAQIEAMKAAYDEFMKKYPDPNKIKNALAAAKALEEAAVEQDGLGYYDAGAKGEFKTIIDEVQAQLDGILAKGQPTVEQVDDMLAKLNAANATFASKLHVPASGLLRIKSVSSNPSNNGRFVFAPTSSRKQHLRDGGKKKDEGADTYSEDPEFENQINSYWQAEKTEKGYSFKNLYTGLYMAPVKNSRTMSQSDEPYFFEVVYAKHPGAFNLKIAKDDASEDHIFLNAQPGGDFNLVLWNSANKNDNSAFEFVTDMTPSLEDGYTHALESKTAPQIITLPIEVTVNGDDADRFFVVKGQNSATGDIELDKAPKTLMAGVPYIYIPAKDNTSDIVRFIPTAESVEAIKPLTKPVAEEEKPMKGLVGVFEVTKVGKDYGVFSTDRSKVLLGEGNDNIQPNTGYFGVLPVVTEKGVASLPSNGTITAIVGAVVSNTSSKAAGIYTISGQRLSSAKNLPAGVYVINGKKVVVK